MKIQKEMKTSKTLSVKKFFFPFSPIKSFRSTRLLFLMAILIALTLVLSLISIRIPIFGLSISLTWVPVMVMGWYFGPVIGLFLGLITDTLTFLIRGGVWFWMYAIQQPIVGMVAGLIAGLCRIRIAKQNKHITWDVILNQIIVIAFAIVSYVILITWLNPGSHFAGYKPQYDTAYNIYKWVAISGIALFVVIYEVLISLTLTKKIGKKEHKTMLTFLYTSICVIVLMFVFSFALGPITAVEYFKFINGGIVPENFIKYGSIFYLVPRVAIESIKCPIESLVLFGVVSLFDMKVINIVNKINCSWQNK